MVNNGPSVCLDMEIFLFMKYLFDLQKAGADESEDKDKDDNNLGLNVDEGFDLLNGDEDSSDYDSSSDEDNVVEFMPDGEVIRKKSRGFKQLNNCKRFWKASMMLEKGRKTFKKVKLKMQF